MKDNCKHLRQSFTQIMDNGEYCRSYNKCADCNEELPASIAQAERWPKNE